jgi:hypothetical protein
LAKLGAQAHDLEINENTDNACPNVMAVFAKAKAKKFENTQRVSNSLRVIEEENEVDPEVPLQKVLRDLNEEEPEDYSTGEDDEELKFMNQTPGKPTQDMKKMPCYKILHGENCELNDKCPYSHDKELLQKYATNMYNKWKKCAYVNHSMAQQKPVNQESGQRKSFMSRGNLRILQRESDDFPTHDHA